MKIDLKFSHFEQLHKNGYTLDMVYLLNIINSDDGVDLPAVCCDIPKLEVICKSLHRKGLVTEQYALTNKAKDLLEFLNSDAQSMSLVRKRKVDASFDRWWKVYPGTDTFRHKGKTFTGTRSMRVRKDECVVKFDKIIEEGEYTVDELVAALEYEVLQKKENSVSTKTNRLTFMQNSLTYLNQRSFEPFIDLIREGITIKEQSEVQGGTDI